MPLRPLFLALAAALVLGACGSPRPLAPTPGPPAPPPLAVPTSATHYRAFSDAGALAAYLRYTPTAPPLVSAHRGGPAPGLPENSLAAFEYSLNFAPALLECDIRRAADGTLVLLHDETLDRTTTGTGPVGAQTLAELRRHRLRAVAGGEPTPHRIPTLAEALAWAEGRAVLLLDVKRDVPPEEVVAEIRRARAENRVVVIVYSLEALLAYTALAPELNYSAAVATPADADALLAAPVDRSRIIAWAGVGRADPDVVARMHAAGIRVQMGTFGALDRAAQDPATPDGPSVYAPALQAGVDVLATDNVPGAAIAVQREAQARARRRR